MDNAQALRERRYPRETEAGKPEQHHRPGRSFGNSAVEGQIGNPALRVDRKYTVFDTGSLQRVNISAEREAFLVG